MSRLADLKLVTLPARKSVLLTLYAYGFLDELFALLEAGEAGTEHPEVLGFLLDLMVRNKDVVSAFSVASIVFGQLDQPIQTALEAFKPLIGQIIEKQMAAPIFDRLAALPVQSLAAVEEVMRSSNDPRYLQCLILFLIYTARLTEAAELYREWKGPPNPLIELLLQGRNNSMPAIYKIAGRDSSLARLHYPDASLCNKKAKAN